MTLATSVNWLDAAQAMTAMQDSGFKSTAYAIAELVDNSIQAGLIHNNKDKKRPTDVEIFVISMKKANEDNRQVEWLQSIAVYDNASGMDSELLHKALAFGQGSRIGATKGMGKFGMGLPNSSISQCDRCDVYSWQDGKCFHTYLDKDEIAKGINSFGPPKPKEADIPAIWRKRIKSDIDDCGSLVIWTKLRSSAMRWKSWVGIFNNSEQAIGRMYRYFLNDGKVQIRMRAFEEPVSGGSEKLAQDREVLANDPLFLMTTTCAPSVKRNAARPQHIPDGWDEAEKSPFMEFDTKEIIVGKEIVKIKASMVRKEIRLAHYGGGGVGTFTVHAKKNRGISFVREGRELILKREWCAVPDTDRWWAIEVDVPAALDKLFEIPNNKQDIPGIFTCSISEDSMDFGCKSVSEYKEYLVATAGESARLANYEINTVISELISEMNIDVKAMTKGMGTKRGTVKPGTAEDLATAEFERRVKAGIAKPAPKPNKEELEEELKENQDMAPAEAKAHAEWIIRNNLRYSFASKQLSNSIMFDIQRKKGHTYIYINSEHPLTEKIFDLLNDDPDGEEHAATIALKCLFASWACMERDEDNPARRTQISDLRLDWGRVARDYLTYQEDK